MLVETVDYRGRHATVRSVRVGEAKATFPAVSRLTNEGDGVVRLVKEATGQVDEEAARFGQLNAAAGAIQELDAELLLESPDLLADRGWAMCSRSAARPKCNSSATVRK